MSHISRKIEKDSRSEQVCQKRLKFESSVDVEFQVDYKPELKARNRGDYVQYMEDNRHDILNVYGNNSMSN